MTQSFRNIPKAMCIKAIEKYFDMLSAWLNQNGGHVEHINQMGDQH